MNTKQRLKSRDALLRKHRAQGKSADWISSWLRGWKVGGQNGSS